MALYLALMAVRRDRKRTVARAQARASKKLDAAREKLFRLEEGGSPERPIEVGTTSIIEGRVSATQCPACQVGLRYEEQLAHVRDAVRLREVLALCGRCGRVRSLWFRINAPLPN